MIKEIFTWWNRHTFGTRLETFFLVNLSVKMNLVINIIKAKKTKDGLYIMMRLIHQKFLANGTHGYITQKIK